MKFKDLVTGAILEVDNAFVVEQCQKHSDRYKEVKPEPKKVEEKK